MKRSRIFLIALSIIMLIALAFSMAACSDSDDDTKIKSVKLNKKGDKVTLKATLDEGFIENNSKETLYLLALPGASVDDSLDGAIVVDQTRAKRKLKFKFDLYEGDVSLVSYGFVIAKQNGNSYTAVTDVAYIENADTLASSGKGDNSTEGIKGLASKDVYGALNVGAEHVLFETRMDKLMLPSFEKGAIPFNYNGITYYFDKESVEELEKLIDDADALGMRVYLRTTLGMNDESEEDGEAPARIYPKSIYCRGAEAGAKGYLPNLEEPNTANWIKAFYAFVADRYPVSDFIIGDNVNNYGEYCNAGDLTAEEFEEIYYFWARSAHLVLSSENSSAKVYIPIDNAWQKESAAGHIGSKVFITRFSEDAKKSGDYPYGIAFDLGEGKDMNSLLSGTTYDYDTLGVSSLGDVANLFKKKDFEYDGKTRSLIIDDLSLSNESMSEENRAAYYTFAYYTAAKNGFDAIITSSPLYSLDRAKGGFYYALLLCGSDESSQLSGYTDKLKNVSLPSFEDHKKLDLSYAQKPSFEIPASALKKQKELPLSYEDFTLGGSAFNSQITSVTNSKGESVKIWRIEADCTAAAGGVTSSSIRAKEIIRSGYIGITMSADTTAKVAIVITNESAKTCTYIGEATVASASTTYYFDISDFAKDAKSSDMIRISICLLAEDGEEKAIEISDISLYGSSGRGTGTVVVIIVVVVAIAALIGLATFLSLRRKKAYGNNGKG